MMEQVARKLTFSAERRGPHRPEGDKLHIVVSGGGSGGRTRTSRYRTKEANKNDSRNQNDFDRGPFSQSDILGSSRNRSEKSLTMDPGRKLQGMLRSSTKWVRNETALPSNDRSSAANKPGLWTPSLERLLADIERGLDTSSFEDHPLMSLSGLPGQSTDRRQQRPDMSIISAEVGKDEMSFLGTKGDYISPMTGQRSLYNQKKAQQEAEVDLGGMLRSERHPAVPDVTSQAMRRGRPSLAELEAMVAAGRKAFLLSSPSDDPAASQMHSSDSKIEVAELRSALARLQTERDALEDSCAAKERTNGRLRQRLRHVREQLNALITELHVQFKANTESLSVSETYTRH
jgi:hypothetical protein